MSRLTWTERDHHGGIDRGVVYSRFGSVEAWNGLISVTESPTDVRTRVRYREGERILNHRAEDSYAATVECFTYPDSIVQSWDKDRPGFDFSYRTLSSKGYELHLVYNAVPRITGGQHVQGEPTSFKVDISTRPINIPTASFGAPVFAPSAHLVLDTSQMDPDVVTGMEVVLYGSDTFDAMIPSPEEVLSIFDANARYQVIDNGDGTFTLEAPDDVFDWVDPTLFEADWPTAVYLAGDTYTVRNW